MCFCVYTVFHVNSWRDSSRNFRTKSAWARFNRYNRSECRSSPPPTWIRWSSHTYLSTEARLGSSFNVCHCATCSCLPTRFRVFTWKHHAYRHISCHHQHHRHHQMHFGVSRVVPHHHHLPRLSIPLHHRILHTHQEDWLLFHPTILLSPLDWSLTPPHQIFPLHAPHQMHRPDWIHHVVVCWKTTHRRQTKSYVTYVSSATIVVVTVDVNWAVASFNMHKPVAVMWCWDGNQETITVDIVDYVDITDKLNSELRITDKVFDELSHRLRLWL